MNRIRFALTLLLILAAAWIVPAQEVDEETVLLTFVPNIQFAPFYAADAAGHFADFGFAVTFEHLNEPDVVDLVAANQNTFGVVGGEQVILSRAQGRPIVFVYEWFQDFPVGIVIPVDQAVETLDDLKGMTIGIPGRFGASYSGFTALITAAGLLEGDIDLQEIGFNAPEVLCTGGVEAAVVYTNNEPLQIQARAAQNDCGEITEVQVIPVSVAVDLVSNGLITNEDTLENNPDLVERFVIAFDRGLEASIQNPAKAYLQSIDYVENLPITDDLRAALENESIIFEQWIEAGADREGFAQARQDFWGRLTEQFDAETLIQVEVLLATIEMWDADQLGFSELSSWFEMQNTLLTLNLLEEETDLQAAFTNEFLPIKNE